MESKFRSLPTTSCFVDIPRIVRKTLKEIGFDNAKDGMDWETCGILVSITEQSPDIAMGVNETETPSNNIKAGIYHLQQLYRSIDAVDEENHIRLTLAAYNAGLNRILDAQDVASFLGDKPSEWDAVKSTLPLLCKRYQSLHSNIWRSGKPRAGYFSDWRQTINYVESVMSHYDHYQMALK